MARSLPLSVDVEEEPLYRLRKNTDVLVGRVEELGVKLGVQHNSLLRSSRTSVSLLGIPVTPVVLDDPSLNPVLLFLVGFGNLDEGANLATTVVEVVEVEIGNTDSVPGDSVREVLGVGGVNTSASFDRGNRVKVLGG